MGLVRMGPPVELALKLKHSYDLRCFIETGTYHGATAAWAAEHFERVITIERSEELYRLASGKYAHLGINFIYGDTRSQLKQLVLELKQPSLFWLDAHWSGEQTYGIDDECPLLEELQIINGVAEEHFLLIDDARLFLSPPPRPHRLEQWPQIEAIIDALKSTHKRYTVVIEDVIVSVPDYARPLVARYCQDINTAAWIEQGQRDRSSSRRHLGAFYKVLKLWRR